MSNELIKVLLICLRLQGLLLTICILILTFEYTYILESWLQLCFIFLFLFLFICGFLFFGVWHLLMDSPQYSLDSEYEFWAKQKSINLNLCAYRNQQKIFKKYITLHYIMICSLVYGLDSFFQGEFSKFIRIQV